jgi:hypothetical protein
MTGHSPDGELFVSRRRLAAATAALGLLAATACTPSAGQSTHDAGGGAGGAGGAGGGGGADGGAAGDAGGPDAPDAGALALTFGLDRRPVNATCHAPAGTGADGGVVPAAVLSATGCVDPAHPSEPAAGLIFYDVNAPLWSDGAAKRRWMALPEGARIKVAADGDWELPAGAVLVKSFALGDRPVETRLLVRGADGEWAGYSYAWRADGSDADLLASSIRRTFGAQEWTYPSREDCLLCHTAAAGRSLGLETAQLNRNVRYAAGMAPRPHWPLRAASRGGPAGASRADVRDRAAGRPGARLPARELRELPPPGRRHRSVDRSAVHDRARRHPRVRRGASQRELRIPGREAGEAG